MPWTRPPEVAGCAHLAPGCSLDDLHIEPDPERRYDVVLLDMDGTLVDERSSWEWVHHHFGVSNRTNWLKYEQGEIDDEEFTRSDIALWTEEGQVHIDDVRSSLHKAPLMPGTRTLVEALHGAGSLPVIVSGGLDVLAHRVAQTLDIPLVAANGVEVEEDGYLNGNPRIHVPIRDKTTPSRAILDALEVPGARAAAVGNSRYDEGMFRVCDLGIAFYPLDDDVRAAADVVIEEKDLARCIPHLLPDQDGL